MGTALTLFVPLVSLVVGTWLGAWLSHRNTLRLLDIQTRQKDKERNEERATQHKEEIREWFENYAIDQCVDPLLTEILFLQDFLLRAAAARQFHTSANEASTPTPPYDACIRIFVMTGAANFPMLLSLPRAGFATSMNEETCQKFMKHLNYIRLCLIRLRQYLISTEIINKSDVHNLCNVPRIQKLAEALDQQIDEMLSGRQSRGVSPITELLREMSANAPSE
ncbi:MAG TPA: hypothetical protein VNG71_09175 [Pyrinomonadaceae bacterium]|nr:hypothetical protein [Pyrinomonadaceae bacterium]